MSIIIKKDVSKNEYHYFNSANNEEGVLERKLEKKTGINWIVLPENEYNRQYLNPSKVDKNNNEYVIDTIKISRERKSDGKENTPRKNKMDNLENLMEYLTDEEKEVIERIKKEAFKRFQKTTLENQIEAIKSQIEQLDK